MAVYLAIGAGMICRWIGWLTDEADQSLLRLVVRILYPALIFSVVSQIAELRDPQNLIWPPLVGFATMALGFMVAGAVARLGRRATGLEDAPARRTFALCAAIYNYGFVPVPLVQALFDKSTMGVLFVHNVGCDMAVWTLGMIVISGHLGRRWWQHVLNAPSIAIALALAFNLARADHILPRSLTMAVQLLGQAGIPMSVIMIGAIIADEIQSRRNGTRADGPKTIAWSLLLRLALLPAAFIALAAVLPCSADLKRVMVVQAAMPCGTFPIVMARHYGGHAGVALRVALSTSLVSLLTIPLWIQAGIRILGL
jgi:predicted permease